VWVVVLATLYTTASMAISILAVLCTMVGSFNMEMRWSGEEEERW
jgi:ABC-type thiamin/hydroxymethylpyrimidine transport system permease subunit